MRLTDILRVAWEGMWANKLRALLTALGVIIGAAFGKIVTSVVGDLLMPPIGLASGGMDFKSMKLVIGCAPSAQMKRNTVSRSNRMNMMATA